ncbi:hypothetical protein B5800_10050 [Gilliamella apicola]|uniref:hypothetical protein n=4 Tax=Gilliamella apicola TaxID=1196095 RepID=UPI000A060219|nr:hypothetical protein [Gilliamella apicola]ORF44865.1 hypothetical protein B5800_10050 [Gilliamella apicola]ORF47346.1 hypothetical protein B5799_12915 [Gilliamella apicola]ORF51938.1 hypothetical protein B5798_12640 [Gilliamella apicola]ORF60256.1 hypothetical protein B5801_05850 [Gilliamella apicola]
MNKLEKDCTYPPNYLQSIYDSKEQEVDKLCPVKKNNLKFDLKELYKFIYKEPIIIYNGQDFQLTLSMSENNENNDIGSDGTIYGGDIFLSIVKDNIVKDQVYLANNYINLSDFAAAQQHYFISPEGEINTLYLIETEDGICPMFWKHYKIDNQKMKFVLQDMLVNVTDGVQYQIIYPNQFNIISNKPVKKIDSQELKSCEDEYDKEEYYSCYIDVYKHYNNRLKQKINLLNKNNNTIKKSYLKLQQKMASCCLELPPPVSGNRGETDPYLSKVMFCLIQNYKQEITNIEKQLPH